jgi:hypothetical protein
VSGRVLGQGVSIVDFIPEFISGSTKPKEERKEEEEYEYLHDSKDSPFFSARIKFFNWTARKTGLPTIFHFPSAPTSPTRLLSDRPRSSQIKQRGIAHRDVEHVCTARTPTPLTTPAENVLSTVANSPVTRKNSGTEEKERQSMGRKAADTHPIGGSGGLVT